MKANDFTNAEVYYSLRSPFARRIRLAFLEAGCPFQERVCDVFHPTPELLAINPLARVPALRLTSGRILIDSTLILQAFYENVDSPLQPTSSLERLDVSYWAALSVGICEKTVEFFLDSLRPEVHRDSEVRAELQGYIDRILPLVEKRLKESQYLAGSRITQADLDMTTALTYLCLRYSSAWKEQFPLTCNFVERLEKRPTFQKTHPPA